MANGIIPVQWGKELRPSAVNSLDKINEVIHFINQSDIHEFTFSDSGSGESVQTANSTQLLDLTVHGKSVQDGTPTPENPVPVQVVNGRNLLTPRNYSTTISGVTFTDNGDNTFTLNGTATASADYIIATADTPNALFVQPGAYNFSAEGLISGVSAIISGGGTNGYPYRELTVDNPSQNGTATSAGKFNYIMLRVASGTSVNTTVKLQLESGTTATPFTPYGCIGLQIGETVTPIDLQGHTLAGLPDGTRDELDIDAVGVKSITQNVGYIASYDGESVGDIYISTTGQLTTGASVYYKLDTPQTIELGTIEPPAIPDGSIIKIDASLTPVIDAEWFTESTLPKMMNSILGLIKSLHPDEFTANMGNSLHSINPISIPELKPISDIKPIGEVEMGYEQEDNESEVQ